MISLTTTGRNRSLGGMSLIEVMLALTVLTVGICASMSHFATLASMRRMAAEANIARSLVSSIAERFQGCRWDAIDTPNAPWSHPRLEPCPTAAGNLPMMDDQSVPVAERAERGLQTMGLLQGPSSLEDLRVYVEFYRALTAKTEDGNPDLTKPGLMDGEPGGVTYTGPEDFQQLFRMDMRYDDIPPTLRAAAIARRNAMRLDTATPPAAQIGEYDPVAIRIIATWGKDGDPAKYRSFALFTARKR